MSGGDRNPAEGADMTKARGTYSTIAEYIGAFPKEIGMILQRMRQTIREAAPGAEEAISYQMPTFKLNGKNLVHFAAFGNHLGFYLTPSGIEEFKKELGPYKGGKGSVQFPLDEPVPFDLVRRIVLYRVQESHIGGER